jgi:heme/copper-type cytochrome/quinol oxidase subunit 2
MAIAVYMLAGIIIGVTVLMFSVVWPMRRRLNREIGENFKHCQQIHNMQIVLKQTVESVYGTYRQMPPETAQFADEMKEDKERVREEA